MTTGSDRVAVSSWIALEALLRKPAEAVDRIQGASGAHYRTLLWASLLGCLGYGAVAGLFQGGSQVVVASLKAPLIVGGSVLLCVPSLYVFTALAGAEMTGARLGAVLAGFTGMLALILIALLPVAWLFSVSSRTVGFATFVHLVVWITTLSFAGRFLRSAFPEAGPRKVAGGWIVLLAVVSFQVTTQLRPVLWRAPGSPFLAREKMFFLDHLDRVFEGGSDQKQP